MVAFPSALWPAGRYFSPWHPLPSNHPSIHPSTSTHLRPSQNLHLLDLRRDDKSRTDGARSACIFDVRRSNKHIRAGFPDAEKCPHCDLTMLSILLESTFRFAKNEMHMRSNVTSSSIHLFFAMWIRMFASGRGGRVLHSPCLRRSPSLRRSLSRR